MFFPTADIFKELRYDTIDAIANIAKEESYDKGAVLYRHGDEVNHFYILQEGKIKLTAGEPVPKYYIVENLGEAFCWSSVAGNSIATADVECLAPTKVWKMESQRLIEILENHPTSGLRFFRRLAEALGQRFVNCCIQGVRPPEAIEDQIDLVV